MKIYPLKNAKNLYSFTGAKPELLNTLPEDKRVEVVRLKLNYRSKASIVSASEVALGEKRGYVAASGDGGFVEFNKCQDGFQHQAQVVCSELIPTALKARTA